MRQTQQKLSENVVDLVNIHLMFSFIVSSLSRSRFLRMCSFSLPTTISIQLQFYSLPPVPYMRSFIVKTIYLILSSGSVCNIYSKPHPLWFAWSQAWRQVVVAVCRQQWHPPWAPQPSNRYDCFYIQPFNDVIRGWFFHCSDWVSSQVRFGKIFGSTTCK